MDIQWYPGHMTKAKRMIVDQLKYIDLVIEVIDARIPRSSRNPDIDKISKNKARLIILNKADLADEKCNNKWISYFESLGLSALCYDAKHSLGKKEILNIINVICDNKNNKKLNKIIINRPIRAMLIGIPNVGKSTIINSLIGRKITITGNKPGVTKGKQWIRLNNRVELLDTPGLLWPKFESELIGKHIAYIGSLNDNIINIQDIAYELMSDLLRDYSSNVYNYYSIDNSIDDINDIFNVIAQKQNMLLSKGRLDLNKAYISFILNFRIGKFGKITIETV